MVSTGARQRGGPALVLTAVITFGTLALAALPAGASTSTDPTSAKAVAKLLAAKKLGCRDFSSANETGGATSTTLPSTLQQLALLLNGADLGTCTIGGQQTLLAAFKSAKARRSFEGTLTDLPCAIVQSALPSSASTSGASAGTSSDITVPLVDIGTRGIVFSTGTAPETDQVDLVQAGTTDSRIAAAVKGKVRNFTYHCA